MRHFDTSGGWEMSLVQTTGTTGCPITLASSHMLQSHTSGWPGGERQSSDWRRILDRRVNFRALVYWCFMTKTCPHSQLHQQIWGSRKLSIFKVQNPSKYLFEWLVGCLRLFFAPFVKKFQEFLWTFDKVTHLSELSKSISWKEIWVKQCWVWSDLD